MIYDSWVTEHTQHLLTKHLQYRIVMMVCPALCKQCLLIIEIFSKQEIKLAKQQQG